MSNIITATFYDGKKLCITEPQFKGNQGCVLVFDGLDLPEYYTVDFSNSMNKPATSMLGSTTGVIIPDEMFASGKTIYAWIVLSDDGGRITKYEARIPILERADTDDIEPTPEQETIIEQAIDALNNAEERLSEAMEEIKTLQFHIDELGQLIETIGGDD